MIQLVSANNLPTSQRIGTYEMEMACPNCFHKQIEKITKGVLVAEWNYVCCRCAVSMQQYEDYMKRKGS